jgi:hypothetical protein
LLKKLPPRGLWMYAVVRAVCKCDGLLAASRKLANKPGTKKGLIRNLLDEIIS